jgi:PIN domain nuclease of toxin-antitoxin system
MKLLLDTHMLLWMSENSPRLSAKARQLLEDPANEIIFSVVSIWEIAIKQGREKEDFSADPVLFRQELRQHGFTELEIAGRHVQIVGSLPLIHKDPFDRLLVAQSIVEGITLLTADATIAKYPAPILRV